MFTLAAGTNSIVGKAVIVHEKADDFKTQPTGNAGGRIACGVIELGDYNISSSAPTAPPGVL